jgi:hypothetical protein
VFRHRTLSYQRRQNKARCRPKPDQFASEEASDVTGCTVAVAGGNLSIFSDPARERTLSRDLDAEGRWDAEDIADSWEALTEGFETTRLNPGY